MPSTYTGQGYLTPYSIIGDPNAMFAVSQNMIASAQGYLTQLGNAAQRLQPPVIHPNFPQVTQPPNASVLNLPTLAPIVWTTPAVPAPFSGTLNTDGLLPGAFNGTSPSLNFGTAPAAFNGAVPASPPIDLNFSYPNVALSLPPVPTLMSLNTIPFNGVSLPTIDQTIPELTIVAPTPTNYLPGALYTSGLLTDLKATLDQRIKGIGTGLDPASEAAMWDRAREREYRQMADAMADLDRMESLGYALPPGVYTDARLKITTEMQNTTAGLSRDIAIKQAELMMTNIQGALGEAVKLEYRLIQYANETEQRTFEAAKYLTEAGVQIYNAQVQAYAARLEAYKTKATIFEAQIRGALATVEVYKAQIEAERAKAEINTSLVNLYKVEVDAALANLEIYKAQVQIITTRAEVEKIKVQVFGEQVRAYGSQINAYTANVEGYKASIQAEGTKQEAFKSQVEAYSAQVTAGAKAVDAKVAVFKGQLDGKIEELDAYKAAVQAMVAQAQAAGTYNTNQTEIYRAEVAGVTAYNELLTKQWQAAIDEGLKAADVAVASAKANGELYISTRSLAQDASKVGAQVAAQLGAASLNAIHWSNSVSNSTSNSMAQSNSLSSSFVDSTSNSTSNSTSTSDSTSHSDSNSTSDSTSHTYEEIKSV